MAKEKKKFSLFKKNKDKELKQDENVEAIETEESLEDASSVDVQQDAENITTDVKKDLNESSDEESSTDKSEDSPIAIDQENLEDSQETTKEEPKDLAEEAKDLDIAKSEETETEANTKQQEDGPQTEKELEDVSDKSTQEVDTEQETPIDNTGEEANKEQKTSNDKTLVEKPQTEEDAKEATTEEVETTKASDEEKNEDEEVTAKEEAISPESPEETEVSTEKNTAEEDAKEATTEEVETTKANDEEKNEDEGTAKTEEASDEVEEPVVELDPETIEQQEKEEAERILKEQEEERLAQEQAAEEQRKRDEAWEKEKARLALERKLKAEKILQDAIDCADTLTELIEKEAPSEELIEEIQKAEGILEKLQMEIDSPWVEEFKAETEHEKLEEAAAEVLIARAKEIITEIEKMRTEMQSVVPDDLEEDYYLSDEEQDAVLGFKIHKPKEDLDGQEVAEEALTVDEIEKAYDVGVGKELDDYDREILDPVFENYLRMSPNSLKYRYSKLKNEIMSYSQMTHSFDGLFENFRINRNIILRFSVSNDKLFLYCALPLGSLDKKVYPHKKAVGAHGKITPTVIEIKDEKGVANAVEIIAVVMAKNNIMQKKHFVPLAYAERYPLNPNAVILGYEHIPPLEGQYDDEFEYDPITGEIVDGIIKAKVRRVEDPTKLTGKAKLEDMRQVAKTIKASVAMTEPIVYFYDAAVDVSNNVQYINIQQVLNDKFFGKIVPQSYFAVAEGSDRIETLNFLALEHAVQLANASKNLRFVLAISVRLLLREQVFERLLKNAKTENHNLVLAFDCSLLESIGDIGLNAITKLRNECSSMIMIDNAENAGMRVLTEYNYEYLRFDARYYAGESPRQQAHLQMLAQYCKTQNIRSTSINVLNMKEAQSLIRLGVEIIQGYAVSEPKRNLNQAVRNIKKIPPTH